MTAMESQIGAAGRVCRRQPGQAEGIRLDGISPCRQILPVDSQHPRRVGQVGLLALHPGSRLIIGTHGTIKKQGAGLQQFANVHHIYFLASHK